MVLVVKVTFAQNIQVGVGAAGVENEFEFDLLAF